MGDEPGGRHPVFLALVPEPLKHLIVSQTILCLFTLPRWMSLGAHLGDGVTPIGLPEFSESANLKGIHRTGLEILGRDGTLGTGD